jgi:hypothetical protein
LHEYSPALKAFHNRLADADKKSTHCELSAPGVTGFVTIEGSLGGKWLELDS